MLPESSANIVAIIPARFASTRLPGKVLLEINGKPLIQYVYESVSKSKLIGDIIVATDNQKVVDAVELFGGKAILTPSEMKSGSDRIAYVARNLENAEIIVNVQGDEPLISNEVIDNTTNLLLEDQTVLVATPIKRITDSQDLINPNVVKVVVDKFANAIYFSRSMIPYCRDAKGLDEWIIKSNMYFKHIGIYVFRRDFLIKFSDMEESKLEKVEKLEQLRIIENGYKIKTIITDYENFSVDTMEDFEKIKELLTREKRSYGSR